MTFEARRVVMFPFMSLIMRVDKTSCSYRIRPGSGKFGVIREDITLVVFWVGLALSKPPQTLLFDSQLSIFCRLSHGRRLLRSGKFAQNRNGPLEATSSSLWAWLFAHDGAAQLKKCVSPNRHAPCLNVPLQGWQDKTRTLEASITA